jgi:hypothetical protein
MPYPGFGCGKRLKLTGVAAGEEILKTSNQNAAATTSEANFKFELLPMT